MEKYNIFEKICIAIMSIGVIGLGISALTFLSLFIKILMACTNQ